MEYVFQVLTGGDETRTCQVFRHIRIKTMSIKVPSPTASSMTAAIPENVSATVEAAARAMGTRSLGQHRARSQEVIFPTGTPTAVEDNAR